MSEVLGQRFVGYSILIAAMVFSRPMMAHRLAQKFFDEPWSAYVVGLVTLLLLGFWVVLCKRAIVVEKNRLKTTMCISLVLLYASLFWTFLQDSARTGMAYYEVVRAVLPYLEFGLLLVLFSKANLTNTKLKNFISATVILLVMTVCIDSVFSYDFTRSPISLGQAPREQGLASPRPGGILGNRNYAGEYLGLAIGVFLAFVVNKVAFYWRLFLIPFAMALVWTRSRTGWLAMACANAIFYWHVTPLNKRRNIHAFGLLVIGMMLAIFIPTTLHWGDTNPYGSSLSHLMDVDSGSGAYRKQQYLETVRILAKSPWQGLGLGQWQRRLHAESTGLQVINRVPHSDYLRVAADLGLMGAFAMFLLFCCMSLQAWQQRREFPETLAFMAALWLVCLADVPLYRVESIALISAIFAFCMTPVPSIENSEPLVFKNSDLYKMKDDAPS